MGPKTKVRHKPKLMMGPFIPQIETHSSGERPLVINEVLHKQARIQPFVRKEIAGIHIRVRLKTPGDGQGIIPRKLHSGDG